MTNLQDHPLVADRLAKLRAADCPPEQFRKHVTDLARLLVLPATAGLATSEVSVTTPLTTMTGRTLARPLVLVPILRAGLGLSEAFLELLPQAAVAHYGMARNETTLEPEVYLARLPEGLENAEVFVLDPMLATGGSADEALSGLKSRGARHLHFVCLVASPEGVARLHDSHPDVPLTTAALDDGLDQNGFIVPGLGDAGDRIFGT